MTYLIGALIIGIIIGVALTKTRKPDPVEIYDKTGKRIGRSGEAPPARARRPKPTKWKSPD